MNWTQVNTTLIVEIMWCKLFEEENDAR